MIQVINISIEAQALNDNHRMIAAISQQLSLASHRVQGYKILRRSLDARSRQIKFQLKIEAYIDEPLKATPIFEPIWQNVSQKEPVIIIGAGPAGLFAALKLIELGKKPILIERGKDVRNRRRDLALLNKTGIVNPDSNYCFGEGGAGTYSDGKLYTRSTKRGDVYRILQLLVYFGADEQILVDAHPHIGTNKLPQIISAISKHIIHCGGELYFETTLKDLIIKDQSIKGILTQNGSKIEAQQLILATGHSARDVYELLERKNILIEAKDFALGVRIEHPQQLIDQIQYSCSTRADYLPPATYSLVSQADNRGVFSFCMCPGGIIAAAATGPNELVVNGWSPSKRNNPYANSGTVVSVGLKDYARYGFKGPLAGLEFQKMVEQSCYTAGGGKLVAPAQRMTDFVMNKNSATLPSCSYIPGIKSINLNTILPTEISNSLHLGIKNFGQKMKGYYTQEALLVATESRTSSPVRIPRDKDLLVHPQIKGLYPCAEGAGYAGGIISAAIDGERCATSAAFHSK